MPQRNEGEGGRTAAQEYSRRARPHVKTGRARKTARKAAATFASPEGTALGEGGIKGKSEARGEDRGLSKQGTPGRDPKPDPDTA